MLSCVSWCVVTGLSRNSSASVFMVVLVPRPAISARPLMSPESPRLRGSSSYPWLRYNPFQPCLNGRYVRRAASTGWCFLLVSFKGWYLTCVHGECFVEQLNCGFAVSLEGLGCYCVGLYICYGKTFLWWSVRSHSSRLGRKMIHETWDEFLQQLLQTLYSRSLSQ